MAIDIVCGKEISEDTRYKLSFEGEWLYFCSEECMKEFVENPVEYLYANVGCGCGGNCGCGGHHSHY